MARVDYDNRMRAAFAQLQDGQHQQALDNLQRAGQIAQEKGYNQTELKRLLVETNLASGNNAEAYSKAEELLKESPQSAYANELMGKVLLKEGDYGEAEKYFIRAREGYEASVDTSRTSDLVVLARYLAAYKEGNPRLAARYLREIKDSDLQYAVDKAQKDIMARGLN
jgi:tetratricopeptide (TPR) repeat protein